MSDNNNNNNNNNSNNVTTTAGTNPSSSSSSTSTTTKSIINYKLSKELRGHSKDVRSVCVLYDGRIVTGSRDFTVRVWDVYSPIGEMPSMALYAHSHFVGALTALKPNNVHQRLFASGGNDKVIYVWDKNAIPRDPKDQQDASKSPILTLIGHTDSISTLSQTNDGLIISGSWDNTIKLWSDNAECIQTLTKHERAVWSVLGLPNGDIVSASADKSIIIWRKSATTSKYELFKTLNKHKDCVRGLALVPELQMFISCSNDGLLAVWTFEGDLVQEFSGHQSFVYAVGYVPSVGFVSCSEDRSLRIWADGECVQNIAHPSGIWSLAVSINGDIVTACSDGVARVWTRNESRYADPQTIELYHQQLAQQQIQSDNIGDIKMSDLKEKSSLSSQPGRKDGETRVIREDGKAMAYQWSATDNDWIKIGEVVDSNKSNAAPKNKTVFEGKEYDYLGYNLGENPYEVAQQFMWKNQLDQRFLDDIAGFLIQNTDQSMTIGHDPINADPLTGGNRYVPGSAPNSNNFGPAPPSSSSGAPEDLIQPNQYIPQGSYVYFEQANNVEVLLTKLREFNPQQQQDNLKLDEDEINQVKSIFATIKETSRYHASSFSDNQYRIISKLLKWSNQNGQLIPILDLLRTMVMHPSAAKKFDSMIQNNQLNLFENLMNHSIEISKLPFSLPNLTSQGLIIKILVNLIRFDMRKLVLSKIHQIANHFNQIYQSLAQSDKPFSTTFSTLLLDLTVLAVNNKDSIDNKINLFILTLIEQTITRELGSDGDVMLRLVCALGTMLFVHRSLKDSWECDRSIIISIIAGNQNKKVTENLELISALLK
ncbi:hypothetical protein DFA_02006 [Cavenderia fasciculata]|uniref:Phospholipase A-2-activating protein n=1 Tax=Cavenderia fasciculata TaxID=261658 RepID=F4PRC2_CACFS|nr:uncharacterized protein DFA_02006 [Cavenderia fasciculata]EGG22116.1 hypothetical protein DFA_02006 [Cavenderia fasciculata]|eukprot:XP_004359967.1 hypothetical protein DFA_02006 [Cavenderia fasciculata]